MAEKYLVVPLFYSLAALMKKLVTASKGAKIVFCLSFFSVPFLELLRTTTHTEQNLATSCTVKKQLPPPPHPLSYLKKRLLCVAHKALTRTNSLKHHLLFSLNEVPDVYEWGYKKLSSPFNYYSPDKQVKIHSCHWSVQLSCYEDSSISSMRWTFKKCLKNYYFKYTRMNF